MLGRETSVGEPPADGRNPAKRPGKIHHSQTSARPQQSEDERGINLKANKKSTTIYAW